MAGTSRVDVGALLDDASIESRALLVEGPAGIGKTHLWNVILREASDRGWRPLRARPSEADRRLVGSALIDLCDTVDDDELAGLPGVQRLSLMAALLRGDVPESVDPRAVALAFTSLLHQLVERGPVALAIDDLQWLDPQTEAVLAYALRRLPKAGLILVTARRIEPGEATPEVLSDLGGMAAQRYEVPPLDAASIERTVTTALGAPVSRPVMRKVVELSAGNPLYAIELGRSLTRGDDAVSASLAALVAGRVTSLGEPTRTAVAAAAALRRPARRQLRELGLADALPAAERAGVIRLDGGTIVFEHPLYAAAAYEVLTGNERLLLHRRLADVASGPEERARHLALGSDEADEDVAAALDHAREQALRRGAVDAALDAGRLAVRASPTGTDAMVARQLALSRLLLRTGDAVGARVQAEAALAADPAGALRARALLELSSVVAATESWTAAAEVLRPALGLAEDDPTLLAEVCATLGNYVGDLDMHEASVLLDRALAVLDRVPDADPVLRSHVLAERAFAVYITGRGLDRAALEEAGRIQEATAYEPVFGHAEYALASALESSDQMDEAREMLTRLEQRAAEEGDDLSVLRVRIALFTAAIKQGRWDEAAAHVAHASAVAKRTDMPVETAMVRIRVGLLEALRGNVLDAEQVGRQIVDESASMPFVNSLASGLVAYCALERGAPGEAVELLAPVMAQREASGRWAPGVRRIDDETYVEALIALGRFDEAVECLDRLEARASAVNQQAILAMAGRLRALLLAAQGQVEQALVAADQAVALWDGFEMPVQRAKALLVKGQLHRRLKQKAFAKQALTEALAACEAVGAALYVERARNELSRVGLRPSAPLDLTATERRVAELAADGRTRAEIAATLFISPHTVAANLTRVYRKTGTSNRAELVRYLAGPT